MVSKSPGIGEDQHGIGYKHVFGKTILTEFVIGFDKKIEKDTTFPISQKECFMPIIARETIVFCIFF
jgi:hypothetical protein